MTEPNRSTTLGVRRPAGTAATRAKAGEATQAGARNAALPSAAVGSERPDGERTERSVRSETLLQGRSHVNIVHNGETYQLRATRLGKLILTK